MDIHTYSDVPNKRMLLNCFFGSIGKWVACVGVEQWHLLGALMHKSDTKAVKNRHLYVVIRFRMCIEHRI